MPTRMWLAAKIMLVISLLPLGVAVAKLAVPVENPGVQRCGSPAMFLVTGRDDVALPIPGDPGYGPQTPALVAQTGCTKRVMGRLGTALWFGGAFVALAATAAVLGLIDQRLQLRDAPRFEALLRERPEGAPGVHWDLPVVPPEDLGVHLPDIEVRDIVVAVSAVAATWIAGALIAGWSATGRAFAAIRPLSVVVVVVMWMLATASSAAWFAAISKGWSRLGGFASTAVSTCWTARIRPLFGWSGSWLHGLIRDGVAYRRAIFEVSCAGALGVAVHASVLAIVGLWVFAGGYSRPGVSVRTWLGIGLCCASIAWGLFRTAARYRQLMAPPGRSALRALRSLAVGDPARIAALGGLSLVQCVAEAGALVAALGATGADLGASRVLFVALLAVALAPLGVVPDGVGTVELVAFAGLWFFGVDPGAAVVAVIVWRIGLRWLAMPVGAIVSSRASTRCEGSLTTAS